MSIQPEDLKRCLAVNTSSWSDALDRLGLTGVCQGLTLRSGSGAFAGTAVTVKEHAGQRGTHTLAEFTIAAVLDALYPGSVLMFDLGGAAVSTFGGLAARAAVQRGAQALVIDGGCRDLEEIRAAGLWACTRHVTPLSGRARVAVEGINVPITIAGTTIRPGDVIMGDETGIVCVPHERFVEVREIAEELTRQDGRFSQLLDQGESFSAAARRLQHL